MVGQARRLACLALIVAAGCDRTPVATATVGVNAGTTALVPCRFDAPAGGAARVALAVAVDGAVALVMNDGSTRTAFRFATERPPSGTSFWMRLGRAGDDLTAQGIWWGEADPASPCELRDGLLNCPETDQMVRISVRGEVLETTTEQSVRSSANIGVSRGGGDAPAGAAPDPGAFTWVFPPGLTPMARLIDSQGWFVAVLRDDYAAGVYRSADAATAWERLGARLGQVDQVSVRNVAGTYVIDALGTNSVFVPTQTWLAGGPAGSAPELLQDSHQLVRPSTGVTARFDLDLDIGLALSSDGLCAASWEATPSGRQLKAYDLTASGVGRPMLTETVGIGIPSSLWIE